MNILVLRFSAMGDVALLTPVLVAVAAKYPSLQINLVTRGNFSPFFFNIPNVHVIGVNIRKFRGIFGIWKLYKEIDKLGPFDKILDMHGSIRSRILSFIYKLKKVPIYTINKGRKEKEAQIRRKNKELKKLKHTVERYFDVFANAGLPAPPRKGPWINVDPDSKIYASEYFKSIGLSRKGETLWIGFAPFAGHALKEFNAKLFLFGSADELEKLKKIQQDLENCFIVSGGKMGLRGELGIMDRMDIMIGMDSSNVHIAALLGKPVIGIYGTTHPYSGFGPYMQDETGVIQVDLPCRPCTIYGNSTCFRKDFACMELIDPLDVIKKMKEILYKKS
ncbi:MAG: glycosyltransferase family 9 protein [Leptospiraceae bacterium]|nr:glycosyltransferase family 9 protein [Leptospiraceae bacterium]